MTTFSTRLVRTSDWQHLAVGLADRTLCGLACDRQAPQGPDRASLNRRDACPACKGLALAGQR